METTFVNTQSISLNKYKVCLHNDFTLKTYYLVDFSIIIYLSMLWIKLYSLYSLSIFFDRCWPLYRSFRIGNIIERKKVKKYEKKVLLFREVFYWNLILYVIPPTNFSLIICSVYKFFISALLRCIVWRHTISFHNYYFIYFFQKWFIIDRKWLLGCVHRISPQTSWEICIFFFI